MPKPSKETGTGMHMHMSIQSTNKKKPLHDNTQQDHFIAGNFPTILTISTTHACNFIFCNVENKCFKVVFFA